MHREMQAAHAAGPKWLTERSRNHGAESKVEKATKRHRVHRAASKRAVRKVVDLRLKNYAIESHPELGV
jgi:hypothetical protein